MSNEIEQSVQYYDLLARKHEASGRGPNQARVLLERDKGIEPSTFSLESWA